MRPTETAPGTLYLVPTPIGHERDITLRALDVLASVDLIAAEDTRNAITLLRRLSIEKHVVSYYDHNERQRAQQLVDKLRAGQHVAVVSDAGMPMLNDPGHHVVKEALAAGVPLVVLPGASSVTTALVASGLSTTSFLFAGFLPRAAGDREQAVAALSREPHTLVLFESPHRIVESLAALAAGLGDRRAALAFELTKPRERIVRGRLSGLAPALAEGESMGEITLVVEGHEPGAIDWAKPDRLIAGLVERGLEPRAIRDLVADVFDLPRREVYQRALERQRAIAPAADLASPDGTDGTDDSSRRDP